MASWLGKLLMWKSPFSSFRTTYSTGESSGSSTIEPSALGWNARLKLCVWVSSRGVRQ